MRRTLAKPDTGGIKPKRAQRINNPPQIKNNVLLFITVLLLQKFIVIVPEKQKNDKGKKGWTVEAPSVIMNK